MGLFGKPKSKPCATMKDFFQQEPSPLLKKLVFFNINFAYHETEPVNYYSPSVGKTMPLMLASYFYNIGIIDVNEFKKLYTYKLPSNLKEEQYERVETLLEVVEQRGDDPNIAFFLGVCKEFGLLGDEPNPAVAAIHYDIAKKQGCRLLAVLDYLRKNTATRDEKIFVDSTEIILVGLGQVADPENGERYLFGILDFTPDEITILKKLSSMGIVKCQEMGYPFSTLLLGLYIADKVDNKKSNYFDNDIIILTECNHLIDAALLIKVCQKARAGDQRAINACNAANVNLNGM